MLATLDCLIKIASEKFDIMEEDDHKNEFSPPSSTFGKVAYGCPSFHGSSFFYSSAPATPKSVLPEPTKYTARTGDSPRSSSTSSLWSLRIQAVGKLNPIDLKRLSLHMSPPHKETKNNKIEKEATRDMEMNHKDRKPEKDTSEGLVLKLETTEKSDITNGDHRETDEPRAMEEEEELPVSPTPLQQQSPKPLETTPMLMQKAPGPVSSSPSTTLTPPPPFPTTNVLHRNMAMPPPPPLPPPPPSAPKLQQNSVAVGMLPPPPPPLPQSSSSAAAAPPPMPSKAGPVPPPPPPLSLKGGSAPAPPPPMPRGNGGAAPPPPPPGAGRSLRPKATTRLKRSTQLGNLYRTLKGKVEGSSLKGKSCGGRSSAIGAASAAGKQGMADALAEMTKRYAS